MMYKSLLHAIATAKIEQNQKNPNSSLVILYFLKELSKLSNNH